MLLPFPCRGQSRIHRAAPAIFVLAILEALPAACAAQPGALTLAEAQQRALVRSRQLAGQDAAIAASQAMAVAARQLPDPMLKAGIDNLPVNGPERYSLGKDFMTMRRIGIEQELTRGEKRELRGARYDRMADKATAEKAQAAIAIERDSALAWLDLRYAAAMAEIVARQEQQAQAELTATEGALRGARASQGDVLAARTALALVHDRASEAERRRLAAQAMLERWIGPVAALATAGTPDLRHLRYNVGALDEHLEHHPELMVLRGQEEVARSEVRLAEAERKPDWRIEASFQQRGPDYSNMVSFGVSVPLQWDRKDRQDREVAARIALAEQARDEREEAQRMHEAETRTLAIEWRNGLERLDRYHAEILPLSADRASALLAAYRGGKATLSELLAARANELDMALQALQLEADTARLWARLNFLFPAARPAATVQDPAPKEQP
jgi:outer membrane protein TolC